MRGSAGRLDSAGNVFTFQEPYGAFTWYPVNDHPSDEALYDAEITTHDGDVGVFNGKLEASESEGDSTTNTWHLEEPAASYLTTIAIGPYTEHVEKTPGGMDISYWLMDRDAAPGRADGRRRRQGLRLAGRARRARTRSTRSGGRGRAATARWRPRR